MLKAGKVYGLRKMSNIDNIKNYTVIDLEMTGLSAKNDKIIEIGAWSTCEGRDSGYDIHTGKSRSSIFHSVCRN